MTQVDPTMSREMDYWFNQKNKKIGSDSDSDSASNGSGRNDDDYLALIEQYKNNPELYKKLLQNPYMFSKQAPFSPTTLQSIMQGIGDFSAEDRYYADLQSQQQQWLSEALESFRQQDYNSPAAQVERERAAGINPEIANNVSPGNAAENDQPLQPSSSMDQANDTLQAISSIGVNIINTSFDVFQRLQGLRSAGLDNSLKSLALNKTFGDSAKDFLRDTIYEFFDSNPSFTTDGFDERNVFLDKEFHKGLDRALARKMSYMNLSRSERKYLSSALSRLRGVPDTDGVFHASAAFETIVNDVMSDLHISRNKFAETYGKPGAQGGENQNALRFISMEIYKPLNDMMITVQNAMLNSQTEKYGYEAEYYQHLDAKTAAGAENQRNQFVIDMKDIKNKVLKSFKEINKRITGSFDLSPNWKLALQAGVASAEAFAMSRFLNFKD